MILRKIGTYLCDNTDGIFSNDCYDYFVYCILHANLIPPASTLSLYRINTDYNTRSFYKSMLLDCFCARAASSFSYSPGRRAHRPSAGSQADRASPSGKTARSNSPPPPGKTKTHTGRVCRHIQFLFRNF